MSSGYGSSKSFSSVSEGGPCWEAAEAYGTSQDLAITAVSGCAECDGVGFGNATIWEQTQYPTQFRWLIFAECSEASGFMYISGHAVLTCDPDIDTWTLSAVIYLCKEGETPYASWGESIIDVSVEGNKLQGEVTIDMQVSDPNNFGSDTCAVTFKLN